MEELYLQVVMRYQHESNEEIRRNILNCKKRIFSKEEGKSWFLDTFHVRACLHLKVYISRTSLWNISLTLQIMVCLFSMQENFVDKLCKLKKVVDEMTWKLNS